MKVLYDMSVVGFGQINSLAKTGIARVVENVARGLVKSKDCDLTFCNALTINTINAFLQYYNANRDLQKVPILYSNNLVLIANKLAELYQLLNITREDTFSLDLFTEVKSHIEEAHRIFIENHVSTLGPEHLRDIDIYHASFCVTPNYLKHKKLINFSTVYDLIPIHSPHFFKNTNITENHIKQIGALDGNDWVLCISESTRNDLLDYSNKIDPAKVFVTYLAADKKMFYICNDDEKIETALKKYNIPNAPYILSLCTLEPRKNIPLIVKSFKKLIVELNDKDLLLVLVGEVGWDTADIALEIQSSPILKDRVIITGHVSDNDLAPIYNKALVFVYPSHYEGFGLPPLEAMQCGVPVITSNNSSLPEVMGDAGIMLDSSDEDGLCQSILNIYTNENLRVEMSCKSIEQSKKFSWNRCINQTIDAYKLATNM